MKAFVTGATGFLGANLVAALTARGDEVRILRREGSSKRALAGLSYEEVLGDIKGDQDALVRAMEGCDCVFHVAAQIQYHRFPDELYAVNVGGTRNVCQAALRADIPRLVYTSSLSAMGISQHQEPLTEESCYELNPEEFPYGHSKLLGELEVRRAMDQGLWVVILNPATMFGPRDVNRNAGAMVIQAVHGRLKFFPPGGSNFIAVRDVVEGHLAALEKGRMGERYILGNRNLTYREIFSLVCQVLGKPAPRFPLPAPVLRAASLGVRVIRRFSGAALPVDANQVLMSMRNIYADSSKAIRELGLPQTPLESAIEETHGWYLANGYL